MSAATKKRPKIEALRVTPKEASIRLAISYDEFLDKLKPGQELSREHIEVLRPCPHDGIRPFQLDDVLGRKVRVPLKAGQHVKWSDLT